MIVRGEAEAALTRPVAAEVGQPTNPIIAEAEAAWRAALAAAMPPPERSPRVRLAWRAAAADDAITAAQDGNSAGLRRNLRRFDALTSGPSGVGRAGGRRAAVGLTGDESPGGAIRAAVEDKSGPGGRLFTRQLAVLIGRVAGPAHRKPGVCRPRRSPRQRQHRRCRTAMPEHALPTRTCPGGNSPAPARLSAGWPGGQPDLGAGRPWTGQPPPLALCWIPGRGTRQVHGRSIGGRTQALAASLPCSRGGT